MSEFRFVVVGDAALFAAIAPIGAERFAGAAPERVVVEADVTGMRLRSPQGEVSFGLPWRVVQSAAADGPDRLALGDWAATSRRSRPGLRSRRWASPRCRRRRCAPWSGCS